LFLVLQHPFADLRGLLGEHSGRLSRPFWPLAEPESDFVRSSGLVRPRRRGGIEEWAGEEVYCDAALALRFPNHLGHAQFGSSPVEAVVDRAFRRFHSDGSVARLDVCLKLRIDDDSSSGVAADWIKLFRDVLEIPVRVRDGKGQTKPVRLVEAGEVLAQHYLAATTGRRTLSPHQPQDWWLCSGSPALIVEYPRWSSLMLPPHSRRVLDIQESDTTLWHAWLQFGTHRCSAWFVAMGHADPDWVRRLRIHLSRLHAARESLRLVLFHINYADKLALADNLDRVDAVEQYLNDSIRAIQQPERFGQAQPAVFEAARQALGVAFEGQAASLQLMRRQVAAKVKGYVLRAQRTATVTYNIQGNLMNTSIQLGTVNVTGDFNLVTATNIQNSFNKAANAEVDARVKDRLRELALQVANLANQLPSEDAERVSKDLEALTSEAVSKKPRKEWYELSAKGIIEAAKAVAAMAGPVGVAVKAVIDLLAR
jgi:hypothetical protein